MAATGFLLWFAYRWRVHILTGRLDMQFHERLGERTRIAQELHDTLLQGVLSASMQLNVANDQMPSDARFKPLVERVIQVMGQVVEDGRKAVRGLRVSTEGAQDLAQAFSRVSQELMVQGVDFRVVVDGVPRTLRPMVRDEVYWMGREALINAFRHARATSIEVVIEYGAHELRILVRDNGVGIDPDVLHSGREGHFGLSGMRERAETIGAKLKVWSAGTGGSEVGLRVPGRIAFESLGAGALSRFFSRIHPRQSASQAEVQYKKVGKS
jgi:signal transduction histidine kinase